MKHLFASIGYKSLDLLSKLMSWRWSKTKEAWISAWHENDNVNVRCLKFAYLALGVFVAYVLVPLAFNELGFMGGISYLVALFGTILNATVFRIVRVTRATYLPLGAIAPIAALIGVFGSQVIRPLLGTAKDAALAQDILGAIIILAVFLMMTLWFRRWQGGNPPMR